MDTVSSLYASMADREHEYPSPSFDALAPPMNEPWYSSARSSKTSALR